MGKFVVKETKTGFVFNLKAGNGEVIATSEVYSSAASCKKGIESVRKCCSARISVGAISAHWSPFFTAQKTAAAATIVLPLALIIRLSSLVSVTISPP